MAGALAAAIAVPLAAGLLLVVAALLWTWWRRRQPQLQQRRSPAVADSQRAELAAELVAPQSPSGSSSLARMPPSGARGWELASTLVSPLLATPAEQVPQLGELLGTGSTGRCFRARWCGADVAVKIFDHDTDLVLAIERQLQQAMAIDHPNIVRLHAAFIYVHSPRGGRLAATTSEAASLDILPLEVLAARTASGTSGHHGLLAGRQTSVSAAGRVAGSGISFSADSSSLLAPRAFSHRSLDAHFSSGHVHMSGASFGGDSSLALPSRGMSTYSLGSQSALTGTAPHIGAAAQPVAGEPTGAAAAPAARTAEHAQRPEDSALLVTVRQHSLLKSSHDTHGCGSSSQSLPFVSGGSRCSGAAGRAETWVIMQLAGTTTAAAVAAAWRQQPESEQQMLARLLLLQDVANGLKELHSSRLNLVHGELTARNVLVSSPPGGPMAAPPGLLAAKLTDHVASRLVKQQHARRALSVSGLSHQAPEVLRFGQLSAAADIYSFGILMWQLFVGHEAYRKLSHGQLMEAVVLRNLRPLVPPEMPADYRLLMERCWASEAAARPSMERVMECLRCMVLERRQQLLLAQGASAAAAAALSTGSLQQAGSSAASGGSDKHVAAAAGKPASRAASFTDAASYRQLAKPPLLRSEVGISGGGSSGTQLSIGNSPATPMYYRSVFSRQSLPADPLAPGLAAAVAEDEEQQLHQQRWFI